MKVPNWIAKFFRKELPSVETDFINWTVDILAAKASINKGFLEQLKFYPTNVADALPAKEFAVSFMLQTERGLLAFDEQEIAQKIVEALQVRLAKELAKIQ